MSGDMMQALSGSSMLSLSFGTLPAGNAGMNLDANPFASQLAQMTGTPMASSGMGAPVVALQGGFSLDSAEGVDDLATPLPDDAGPSQMIEAILGAGTSAHADGIEAAAPHSSRLRSSGKVKDAPVDQIDPAIVAAMMPPAPPIVAAPDFVAPENGTVRIATMSAAAQLEDPADTGLSDLPTSSTTEGSADRAMAGATPQLSAQLRDGLTGAPFAARAEAQPATAKVAQGAQAIAPTLSASAPAQTQALAAMVNLSDAVADPAAEATPAIASGELPVAATRTDAIQPSWVAALNAVTAPMAAGAAQQVAPLDNPASAAPLETLAFDAGFIDGIETQIARLANGGQMVRMQIMPEHLGRIDIEMLAGPDRAHVRLVTEHDAVRDTLVQSQMRLEQDLRQNGQRSAEVTVELRQQAPGSQGGSAQQQRGQAGHDATAQRDTAQRQGTAAASDDSATAPRRLRGSVRYA